MWKAVVVSAFAVASLVSTRASADTLNWNVAGSSAFDAGVKPVVALGSTPYGSWKVEVHEGQAGYGPLWYSSGRASGTGIPAFGNAQVFAQGWAPAIAPINTQPDAPAVVEVHQAQTGFGPLLFTVGAMTSVWSPNTLAWSAPQHYDMGFAPAVAALNGVVVEVHQGQAGFGHLWYRVGSASGNSVTWNSRSFPYDVGEHPAIALVNAIHGVVVVEAHQSQDGFGPLVYRTGEIAGGTILWQDANVYDNGVAPSLAVNNVQVIEVHQGQTGLGSLWYHLAEVNANGIHWEQSAQQYDVGLAPTIAWDSQGMQGLELHQAADGMGPLWQHPYFPTLTVPLYPQVESNWCWITAAEMAMESSRGEAEYNPAMNGRSAAETLECEAANMRQQRSGGWGANGKVLDCCASVSWADATPCNQGGDSEDVLNDNGFFFFAGSPVSFATLQWEFSLGRPVLFSVLYGWNEAHTMVAVGAETDESGGQWVMIDDPGGGDSDVYPFTSWTGQSAGADWILTRMLTNIYPL
ncbi:MAG TPA: hypothetical protein VGI39_33725 [Polyangiaceae bacterium]